MTGVLVGFFFKVAPKRYQYLVLWAWPQVNFIVAPSSIIRLSSKHYWIFFQEKDRLSSLLLKIPRKAANSRVPKGEGVPGALEPRNILCKTSRNKPFRPTLRHYHYGYVTLTIPLPPYTKTRSTPFTNISTDRTLTYSLLGRSRKMVKFLF